MRIKPNHKRYDAPLRWTVGITLALFSAASFGQEAPGADSRWVALQFRDTPGDIAIKRFLDEAGVNYAVTEECLAIARGTRITADHLDPSFISTLEWFLSTVDLRHRLTYRKEDGVWIVHLRFDATHEPQIPIRPLILADKPSRVSLTLNDEPMDAAFEKIFDEAKVNYALLRRDYTGRVSTSLRKCILPPGNLHAAE